MQNTELQLQHRVKVLEETLNLFVAKVDVRSLVNLPDSTRISPKMTALDFKIAAAVLGLSKSPPTAQQERG